MATRIEWVTTDDSGVGIAYSASTVVLGITQDNHILTVKMTPAFAIHLMMELKETLADLNTEDRGETE